MLVTIEEVKLYLRLDSTDEDPLIQSLINTSEGLCQDVSRLDLDELEEVPEIVKIAVFYGVTYLYENREQANFKDLIETLKYLLFGIREEIF